MSGHSAATALLQKRQLHFLGKVLRALEGHPLRRASFTPDTNWPLTERYIRRLGRPCKEWLRTTLELAYAIFDGRGDVNDCAADKKAWEAQIAQHFAIT